VHTPHYPPGRNAGSEQTIREIAVDLARRGHSIYVLVRHDDLPDQVDGIPVRRETPRRRALYKWCDVVLTHLECRPTALREAARRGRPVVHFVQMGALDPKGMFGQPALTVYNTKWLEETHPGGGPTIVVHPPVRVDEYRTRPGDSVTLVSLNDLKGGPLFFELARRLPDHVFLGVRGAWGDQLVPDTLPDNVTIIEQTSDMRDVYGRTRVLLVPSRYETYGRVALEAAVSGIPTIAHPSNGLREAMGDAPTYVDRADVDAWVDAIRSLDDPAVYAERSSAAIERSATIDPDRELELLEHALVAVATL
jgi:glycosyltransferase involved in cell wall biosynthesis